MDKLFLTILKMSITASYVILFVLIIRMLLKKSPKIFSYSLWAVVLFRLICPISFESKISLIPNNSIAEGSVTLNKPLINYTDYKDKGLADNITGESESLEENIEINKIDTANNLKSPLNITSIVSTLWAAAISIMIIYSVYSLVKLKKHLRSAKLIKENIYEAENIDTAFVLGIVNPKIYIPEGLSENEEEYILTHERVHIKRNDYLVKIIWFIALTIHCFNPLVWISFILMSRDMEMSCDEAVIKGLGTSIKREYSMSLLSFATEKKKIVLSPIAFGEGDVKSRIKNVLNYKKPRFWITIVSVIVLVAVALGLIFNPVNKEEVNKYLDVNNALEEIKLSDEVIVRRMGLGGYILNGEGFTNSFKMLKEHKVESEYELASDIVVYIYGSPDYALIFYEAEPKLMKVIYNGESKYYKSYNDMYAEIEKMIMPINYIVNDEVMTAVMNGKKTNKTSYDDRPRGVDYLELSVGKYKYFIYEDKGKYYVERPYGSIYEITEEIYENANKFATEPNNYTNAEVNDAFVEELVCRTIEADGGGYIKEDIVIVAPKIFGYYEEENKLKVFTTVYISNYSLKNNIVESESGGIIPYAITYIRNDEGSYSLEELLPSMDGAYWEKSIREFCTMPVSKKEIKGLADKIINHYGDYSDIIQLERERLIRYLEDSNLKGIYLLEKGYNEPDKLIPLTEEYSGNQNNAIDIKDDEVGIDIGKSNKFSENEINNAIETVKKNFSFPACKLTKIWYDEDKSNKFIDSYLQSGRGSINGAKAEDVIILLSSFDVDNSGDNPVLNPGTTYTDYNWILLKDNETGGWKIDDWGY